MEGLDLTNLYWVRVFSFPSLCLFDLNLFVCLRFNLYSTLNATFKNLQVFSVLWKFAEGAGAWYTGNAWEVMRNSVQFKFIFLSPPPPKNLRGESSSYPFSHVQHFNFFALLSCAMRIT